MTDMICSFMLKEVFIYVSGGGPTQGKQGVKLLSSPVEVEEFRSSCGSCSYNSILDLSATFNSSIGELDVIVNFV